MMLTHIFLNLLETTNEQKYLYITKYLIVLNNLAI